MSDFVVYYAFPGCLPEGDMPAEPMTWLDAVKEFLDSIPDGTDEYETVFEEAHSNFLFAEEGSEYSIDFDGGTLYLSHAGA
jgi:hypothetical protein